MLLIFNLEQLYLRYMNKVVSDKLKDISQLCQTYSVKSMYIFGSAGKTNTFNDNSDIDLLISFKDLSVEEYTDNYFALQYKLRELFKREIDLLTENSLSNPYFIKSIEQTKELLYAA
jgi:predicted nucleotidyltransferase